MVALTREIAERTLGRLRGSLVEPAGGAEFEAARSEAADLAGALGDMLERLRAEVMDAYAELPGDDGSAAAVVTFLDWAIPAVWMARDMLGALEFASAEARARMSDHVFELCAMLVHAVEVAERVECSEVPKLREASAEMVAAARERLWADPTYRAQIAEGIADYERGDVIDFETALAELGEA